MYSKCTEMFIYFKYERIDESLIALCMFIY